MAAADARQFRQTVLPMALRCFGIALPHRHQRVDEACGHRRPFVATRRALFEPGQASRQRGVVAACRSQQRQVQFAENVAALRKVALRMCLRGLRRQGACATQTQAPQQRRSVGQAHVRRALGQVAHHRPQQPPCCGGIVTQRQLGQRAMPLQVAPHQGIVGITGQPRPQEVQRLLRLLRLVQAVQQHMRAMAVLRPQRDGALRHFQALGGVAALDAHPATVHQQPRQFGWQVRRQRLDEVAARGIVVTPAADREEPVGADGGGRAQHVGGEAPRMLLHQRQGLRRAAADDGRDQRHVRLLTRACSGGTRHGGGAGSARLADAAVAQRQQRAQRMGQRKSRCFGQRFVQRLRGPWPGVQLGIDGAFIALQRARAGHGHGVAEQVDHAGASLLRRRAPAAGSATAAAVVTRTNLKAMHMPCS